MIYLGLDWAEDHHDVALMNEAGTVLDERRIGDTMEDVVLIHELVDQHEPNPSKVMVGTPNRSTAWCHRHLSPQATWSAKSIRGVEPVP
jgi:hypothetical protein